jgi:hypothetical protein
MCVPMCVPTCVPLRMLMGAPVTPPMNVPMNIPMNIPMSASMSASVSASMYVRTGMFLNVLMIMAFGIGAQGPRRWGLIHPRPDQEGLAVGGEKRQCLTVLLEELSFGKSADNGIFHAPFLWATQLACERKQFNRDAFVGAFTDLGCERVATSRSGQLLLLHLQLRLVRQRQLNTAALLQNPTPRRRFSASAPEIARQIDKRHGKKSGRSHHVRGVDHGY